MSKYKVVTIAICVKNNRIARFGETVDDSELTVNANDLIEAGSIELIGEGDSNEKAKTKEVVAEPVEEEAQEEVTEEAPSSEEKEVSKKDAVKAKLEGK